MELFTYALCRSDARASLRSPATAWTISLKASLIRNHPAAEFVIVGSVRVMRGAGYPSPRPARSIIAMKQIIAILLLLMLLVVCAASSILMARSWFTLRTSADVQSAPTAAVVAQPPLESLATPTLAALQPDLSDPAAAAGFNGAFTGTLTADNGSSAPATITLSESAGAVTGLLDIGEGLSIDAGNCGVQTVPAGAQRASGSLDPANSNRLSTTGSIPVAGFTIGVALSAELAPGGDSLTTRVDLDLPFLCGRDAAINGTFSK